MLHLLESVCHQVDGLPKQELKCQSEVLLEMCIVSDAA